MDGKNWQDRWIGPVRDTLRKLSPAQRFSLGVLGASLLVGLGSMTLSGDAADDMVVVPIATAEERRGFQVWLDGRGIPHRVDGQGVAVPRAQVDFINLQARTLLAEGKRADHFAWVDEAVSFQETNRARSDKWSDATRRGLEDALRRSEGIVDATVHFIPSRRRTAYGRNQDPGAHASVQLTLDRVVHPTRLPVQRARVAAQFVASALGLNIRNVSVTDDLLNEYRDLSASAVLAHADDDPEARITAKVSDLVEQSFPMGSFRVVVDVGRDFDQRESRELRIEADNAVSLMRRQSTGGADEDLVDTDDAIDPDFARSILGGTGIAPAAHREDADERARDEDDDVIDTEYENYVGEKETTIRHATGRIEGVAITLALQLDTAVEVLRDRKRVLGVEEWRPTESELSAELTRYQEEWRTRLGDVLSLDPSAVKANVHFSARPSDFGTAALQAEESIASAWFSERATSLALIALALVGGLFLVRVARTPVAALPEVPDPVAELEDYLARREERIALEVAERERAAAEETERVRDSWEASDTDQETIDLLEDVIQFAQSEPAAVTGVVRQWMHEPLGARSEGGSTT